MKKPLKQLLSIFLTLIMLLGIAPLGGFVIESSAAGSGYSTGDLITFGSYPQSRVTDSTLISALDAKAKSWLSYGYYSGTGDWDDGNMAPSDYMKYCDLSYGGVKYRAVTFSSYRPNHTGGTSSTSNTYQDDNGYYINNVYYFKFEPLTWRVLDPDEGYVICEKLIDSQAYQNFVYYSSRHYYYGHYYNSKACTTFINDWVTSSIRQWLNNDFYNTAFTAAERAQIGTSHLENKSLWSSTYDSADTYDKIFLPSYWDVTNSSYGFSNDNSRQAYATDYAKSQGCWVSSSYGGTSTWLLRSPGGGSDSMSYITCFVDDDGGVFGIGFNSMYGISVIGIRPAFKFNPQSLIYQSENVSYSEKYFSGHGVALDGVNSTKAMGIPGLGQGMIPQGIGFCEAKNWVLISSYYKKASSDKNQKIIPSKIYALDFATGQQAAAFDIEGCYGHVGGVAAYGSTVYVANDNSIYSIPLSNLNTSTGKATIDKTYNLSALLNNASCSYVSVSDGILWTGNFYQSKDYKTKAGSTNSAILGFALRADGTFDHKNPTYRINTNLEKIQGAIVDGGKLYLNTSYGRNNIATVYIYDVKLNAAGSTLSNELSTSGLPMLQGMFIHNGYMYTMSESAAYYYQKDITNKAKDPSDVVWQIDHKALASSLSFAPLPGDVTNAAVNFTVGKNAGSTKLSFKQSWFNINSSIYNHGIGQLCSQLAMLGYAEKSDLTTALKAIGMNDDVEINLSTGKEEVNYFLANRKIVVNGVEQTLVFAGFIGSHKEQWYSNFDPGTGDVHKGFNNAKNYAYGKLSAYINKIGASKANTKILITGHSRGAATANLVAAKLIEEQALASKENIFTYAFATPNPTKESKRKNSEYARIFNIVNPEDFVTKVMLVGWGYGRYGTTYTLPSKTNTKSYGKYKNNMQTYFSKFTNGEKYTPYATGEAYTYAAVTSLFWAAPKASLFYSLPLMAGTTLLTPYSFFQKTLCHFVSGAPDEVVARAVALVLSTLSSPISNLAYRDVLTYFISGGKITGEFVDAHRAETYCAYMMSMSEDQIQTYRAGLLNSVNCPVDVEIIDKETGEVVGKIVNNEIDQEIAEKENAVVVEVDGDSKKFWLPSDGHYDVVLTGNDNGTMDYSISEIDSDNGEVGRSNFFDVEITKGDSMTGVPETEETSLDEYTLTLKDGSDLGSTQTLENEELNKIELDIEVTGSGTASESMAVSSGDYVTLTAIADERAEFLGWFIDGELISSEESYSFVAKQSLSIKAEFTQARKLGDSNGDDKITSSDALLALQYSTGLIDFNEIEFKATDVNFDGSINSSDALLILQYITGKITQF